MIKNPNDTRTVASGVQKMTPSEAFVETLVANGVTDMFGIMGSAFMDAMDIFAPAGIRLIPVVHEQGAAHMADGYARVSGRHGVSSTVAQKSSRLSWSRSNRSRRSGLPRRSLCQARAGPRVSEHQKWRPAAFRGA